MVDLGTYDQETGEGVDTVTVKLHDNDVDGHDETLSTGLASKVSGWFPFR